MEFILMPKSLNHPICLGSQSYNAKDLLYYGGQTRGWYLELKSKTDELILMLSHMKAR